MRAVGPRLSLPWNRESKDIGIRDSAPVLLGVVLFLDEPGALSIIQSQGGGIVFFGGTGNSECYAETIR